MRSAEHTKISYPGPVVLVGGGDVSLPLVEQYAAQGWPVVCADGGADRLRGSDVVPEAIVGDMDSITNADRWCGHARVVRLDEQDTTDFEKCLYSVDAPLYLASGFTGDRFDHTLASLHVMCKYVEAYRVVMTAGNDVCFVTGDDLSLRLIRDLRFSIYPLQPTFFRTSHGLQYPLNDLLLAPGEMIGTSNRTTDSHVELYTDYGVYAIILPINSLGLLIENLTS